MDDGAPEALAPASAKDLKRICTQFRVRRIGDAVCKDFSIEKILYGVQVHRFLEPGKICDIHKHSLPGGKSEEVLFDQVCRDIGLQLSPPCIDFVRPLFAPYSRKQVVLLHEPPDTLAIYVFAVFLGDKAGHGPVTDTAVMITLKAADHIRDFCIRDRAGILKMIVVALPGYVSNTAEEAHVSDTSSEDFIDGLILDFFLKPDAGVPLSSISASR